MGSMVPLRRVFWQLALPCRQSHIPLLQAVNENDLATLVSGIATHQDQAPQERERKSYLDPPVTPQRPLMQLLHLPPIPLHSQNITNHYIPFLATSPLGPCPRAPSIIPISNIRHEFLQIQSQHHPDNHPFEPTYSKDLALSALTNHPYKSLSGRFSAQYLLQQKYDIHVMSEDISTYKTDSKTLMEDSSQRQHPQGGTGRTTPNH